jgi:DNA-binding transcriptional MerR regulator
VTKSPDAFKTIGEVAALLDVPQHVLRFWEARIGEVRPLRTKQGQRRYRPEDVELLGGIRVLLHVHGYSIRGVQRLLRDRGINYVRAAAGDVAPARAAPKSAAPQQTAAAPVFQLAHLSAGARAALVRALSDRATCRRLAAVAIEITIELERDAA